MKKIFTLFQLSILFFIFTFTVYGNENFTGGGGALGQGTNDNGWVILSPSGFIYDAEGLRIYLVNSVTGQPVIHKSPIDITNYNVPISNMMNGKKKTKHDYRFNQNKIIPILDYQREIVNSSLKLPLIIPWNESNPVARINALKAWFRNETNAVWVSSLLNTTKEEMIEEGWILAIEPIVYLRYMGNNFALTATECAVYNQMASGGLYNKLNPLTHQNLPLSIFLEENAFTGSPYSVSAWTGAGNAKVTNDQLIIDYLGIGYLSPSPDTDGFTFGVAPPAIPDPLPEAPKTVINYGFEATPKEHEIKGLPGQDSSIGKDVGITVSLKQSDQNLKLWRERLKDIDTVDIYITLKQTPHNRSMVCTNNPLYSGSVLSGTKTTIPKSDFLNLLNNNPKFKDSTGSELIKAGETILYNYSFSLKVEFIESSRYATGGERITIEAFSAENNKTETDYASFFREKDPPEYVAYTSNPTAFSEIKQGVIGSEEFEAMAGTPTTEDLFFSVGGSEFVVDYKAELVKNETAQRTYRAYFSSTDCEFKDGDTAKEFTFPSPSGGGTGTHAISMHDGGTCTVTWSGTTLWTGGGGVSGHEAWVNNTWDDSGYNAALTTAQNYANAVNGTVFTHIAASDGVTRTKTSWGASASGSNPHIGGIAISGQPYIPLTPPNEIYPSGHPGQEFIPGEYTPGQNNEWVITVSWTISPHTGCGGCCSHVLPQINDTWRQNISYDYFDTVKSTVWKISQGHLNGLGVITGTTNTTTTQILQGNPTIFQNIAATETSRDGRFRYTLEPAQHDTVVWNLGVRSDKCDKQDKIFGTGIKYNATGFPNGPGYLEANSSDKDKLTEEYAKFKEHREKLVTATVISDFLILQTSSGDLSVLYFEKKSEQVQAQEDFNYVEFTKQEGWDNNSKSSSGWSKNHINIGSYNGNYQNPSTKYNGTGANNRIATIFDSDPANTITRTSRPSGKLIMARFGIDVEDTLPNDDYHTGTARVFWENVLDYNPDSLAQKYSVSAQSLFGNLNGFIKFAPYSNNHSKINDIVIHNPVSADYAMVLATSSDRDQRAGNSSSWAEQKAIASVNECLRLPELCEHRFLNCNYIGTDYHTVNCYTEATPQTLNAHYHTVSCVSLTKILEAVEKNPGTVTFNYTGSVQSFTAPSTGTYTFEVWGAQGGESYHGGPGGLGGYSKGTYNLTSGQKINIYVGGRSIGMNGGWNGGGNTTSYEAGAGGGATDIRINGTSISNRVIVAGGGGGGGHFLVGSTTGSGTGGYPGGVGGGINGGIGAGGYDILGNGGNTAGGSSTNIGTSGVGGGGGGGHLGGSNGTYSESISPEVHFYYYGSGGGGSGYIGGVSDGSTQSGINSGNGKVVISYSSTEYIGESWGLIDIEEIIVDSNIELTSSWLLKQPSDSVIFNCDTSVFNFHICNVFCSHTEMLICDESHHFGEHYDISNTVCWSACEDDSKHAPKTSGYFGSLTENSEMGYFISLDWGFQVYFPTIGDFYQNEAYGISNLTSQRGRGFIDQMITSEWTAEKRVKFGFDVIYCGETTEVNPNGSQHGNHADGSSNHKHTPSCQLFTAGSWIDLPKDGELFNFYCISSNSESAANSATFEVVAINAPNMTNDNTEATNRYRSMGFESKHGGIKTNYIDIVGRIGNLVMTDTGDYRYSNLFKTPNPGTGKEDYRIMGIVKNVDISSKNYVLTSNKDIRGLSTDAGYGQDTYGLLSWLKEKTLFLPLTPDKNNINAFKNQPLVIGYMTNLDITTLGKDYKEIDVVPYFYYYNLDTRRVVPVDVYGYGSNGYVPINLFMNAYKENLGEKVYDFRYFVDWNNQKAQRNVSESEWLLTQSLSESSGLPMPEGKILLGTGNYLSFGERLRTFIGSSNTLGHNQNIDGSISESRFQMSAKRWQFTLGLPSSAVVIDTGAEIDTVNIDKYKDGNGVILMAADIFATSDFYTLKYENYNNGSFVMNGVTYPLPSDVNNIVALYDGNGKSAKGDLEISKTH